MNQIVKKQIIMCPYCGFHRTSADGKHGDKAYFMCQGCEKRFAVPFDRHIRSTLPEGAWAGRRVFIFGGGSSVAKFDWSKLQSQDRTISINSSWKNFYNANRIPTIQFSGDQLFWKQVSNDLLFRKSVGLVAALDHDRTLDRGFLVPIAKESKRHWAENYDDGIRYAANSGIAALNLADVLGSESIRLVGFDLDGTDREGRHFPDLIKTHEHFLTTFEEIAPLVKSKVVVINDKSPLNKIQFGRRRKRRSNS